MATSRLPRKYVCVAMLLAITAGVSCHDPMSSDAEELVIVTSGEKDPLVILSGPGGNVIARPAPVPNFQDAHVMAPNGETLYFTALDSIPDPTLLTLSTQSLSITSRVRLRDLESRSQVDGLSLLGNYALAFSPDGTRLLLADAVSGQETGIAVIDAATLTPVSFIGPLSVSPGGLASTLATTANPEGRVFAIGTRTPGVFPRADSLFILDAATFGILRVAAIAAPAADGSTNLFAMQPSPSGERVYLLGAGRLYAYDVAAQRVIADAPAPQYGSIAVAPDGRAVYVTDPGDRRDVPGAGLALSFGPSLEPRAPVDLRSQAVDGVPPATEGIAVSPNGENLYILSGTASRGPLFGPQPRRVFMVELASGQLARTIALSDYGAGPLFAVR
jgi:DNA-binding beta-propeller fold protein YncE